MRKRCNFSGVSIPCNDKWAFKHQSYCLVLQVESEILEAVGQVVPMLNSSKDSDMKTTDALS